jgi:hypothetical protein
MAENTNLAPPSKITVNTLYNGIIEFYPSLIFGKAEGEKRGFKNFWSGFNRMEFLEFLLHITDKNTDLEARDKVLEWKLAYDKSEQPKDTVPQNINELCEDLDKLNQEKRMYESRVKAKQLQLQSQKYQEAKIAKPVIKVSGEKPPKTKQAEKKVVVTPPQKTPQVIYLDSDQPAEFNTLSDEDRTRLESYINDALSNPTGFVEKITQEIIQYTPDTIKKGLTPAQLEHAAKVVALDFTEKLRGLDPKAVGVSQTNVLEVLTSLANPNAPNLIKIIPDEKIRFELAKSAQGLALEKELNDITAENLLQPVAGPITQFFYNTQKTRQHEVSDKASDRTNYQVSVQDMIDGWKETVRIKGQIVKLLRYENPEVLNTLTKTQLDKLTRQYTWYKRAFFGIRPAAITGIAPYAATAGATVGALAQTSLIPQWIATNTPLLTSGLGNLALPAVAGVTPQAAVNAISWQGVSFVQPLFGFRLPGIVAVGMQKSGELFETIALLGKAGKPWLGIGKITLGNVYTSPTAYRILVPGFKKAFEGPLVNKFGGFVWKTLTPRVQALIAGTTQAGKAAALTAGKAAGKVAGTGIAAKIGAIIGGLSGTWLAVITAGIGAIIGWLVGKVLPKIISWARKNKENLVILTALPILAGIVLGSPLLIALGLLPFIGALIAASKGIRILGSGLRQVLNAGLLALTSVMLPAMFTPFLIAIISIPVIVAVILFIINSGAYLVPPGSAISLYGSGVIYSPYIDIAKTASPTGPFENSELPKEIEYTVTIKAKLSTLTNIRIEEKCDVIKENSKPSCPDPSPSIPQPGSPDYPDSISPTGQGFTFTYKVQYTSPDFDDTLVINTITVTADVPEQANAQASNSAIVKFGNPPEECPMGWPILPEGSETSLDITQGPLGGFSHTQVEAIDVGATIGHTITARHSGVVDVVETNNAYRPVYVTVTSTCMGVSFQSWYAHLSSVAVEDGQAVTMGQVLGTSGTNTLPYNAHLHYEFRSILMRPECTAGAMNCIPKPVPYYCSGSCGTIP